MPDPLLFYKLPIEVQCPGCNDGHSVATQPSKGGWFAECERCGAKLEEIGAWNRWLTPAGNDTIIYIPLLAGSYEIDELADHIVDGALADHKPGADMWHWGPPRGDHSE